MASSSPVALLRPAASLESAVAAFRGGRPNRALALLRGRPGDVAQRLRARAQLRAGHPELALETLCDPRIRARETASHASQAEALVLRAAALIRLHDLEAARALLDEARVFAFGAGCAALEAEYEYCEGVWSFAARDFEAAERSAQRALEVKTLPYHLGTHLVPLEHSRALARHLHALVAAGRERYGEQPALIRRALEEQRDEATRDRWIYASVLMHLAIAVREFDLVEDARRLEAEIEAPDWPDELGPMRFEIYRGLGWSSALRGDHLAAFRAFRRGADIASTPAWKIVSCVDRAFLARELGETFSAGEELEHAADLAGTIDWNRIGEERIGLALLAQEVASFSPERARTLLAQYRRIASALPPTTLAAFDRRVRASESFAAGAVERAGGERERAVAHFCDAFRIWHAIGYRWRAATAALELSDLGAGDGFTAYARDEAARRPHSWLARRARRSLPARAG